MNHFHEIGITLPQELPETRTLEHAVGDKLQEVGSNPLQHLEKSEVETRQELPEGHESSDRPLWDELPDDRKVPDKSLWDDLPDDRGFSKDEADSKENNTEKRVLNKQELSEKETDKKQDSDVVKNQADTPNNPDARNKVIKESRKSELMALEIYGGEEQVSFLNGKEVPFGTPGSTRPDITREVDGKLEAIEVKNYNLNSKNSLYELLNKLADQVKARVDNMPPDTLQRIVLDVSGKQIASEQMESIVKAIKEKCAPFYQDIPVDTI